MLFWTRHANLRRVENYIYDPSARIIKNPLNSTVFWKRRLNPATRRLNSATRSLNSATRQILHWNIVVYFDEASSQLGKASSQLGDASAQLRDASKMQLWPQWLTILRDGVRSVFSSVMVLLMAQLRIIITKTVYKHHAWVCGWCLNKTDHCLFLWWYI